MSPRSALRSLAGTSSMGGVAGFSHDNQGIWLISSVGANTARLIEETMRRYDCDGLELDFNRFPNFFKDGSTELRVAKMNSLVGRVRRMLDEAGRQIPAMFGLDLGAHALAGKRTGNKDHSTLVIARQCTSTRDHRRRRELHRHRLSSRIVVRHGGPE